EGACIPPAPHPRAALELNRPARARGPFQVDAVNAIDDPPKRGTPNKLSAAMRQALKDTETKWGPAMKALRSDRHRAFVLALFQVKPGHGAQVRAAKAAGFGTSTSSAKSWSVIASMLAHDEAVQAAIHEWGQRRIVAAIPRAVRALDNL